ncbi:MAG: hypothetical protein AAF799_16515 [Myxococcota bacterium]
MTASEAWLDDAREAIERRIDASGATPDFLDVVTRAHALDPKAVPESMLEQADALAPVIELDEERERGADPDEQRLDEWLGDVRSAMDRRVEARKYGPTPALIVPRRDRRMVWWVGGAVAAAVALAFAIVPMVNSMSLRTADPSEQALHIKESSGTTGTVQEQEPAAEPLRPRRTRSPVVEPEPEPEPVPEVVEAEPEPEPSSSRSRPRRDRFAALADRAQTYWREGQRDEAQRVFVRITKEAGRSRAAEMAYADLFTLAHQARDEKAQRRWWRAYLRRFPHGRFADDARAGLCRSEASGKRTECWSEYLHDFPRGSFRAEAKAATHDGE